MKILITLCLLFWISVSTVQSYELTVTDIIEPYDVTLVDDVSAGQMLLGDLADFPIMYEVSIKATTTLVTQLSQRFQGGTDPVLFSLLIVRQNDLDGGVTEVARVKAEAKDWVTRKDSVLGLSLWETAVASSSLIPGNYLLEVSTALNYGRYRLQIGENIEHIADNSGYFTTLGQVRTTQKFFGMSFLSILLSSYVYYPFGILVLLLGLFKIGRYRKSSKYVN